MRERHLAVGVLQQIAVSAVKHAGRSTGESRRMQPQLRATAAGFYSDQPHTRIAQEGVKYSDRIAAAADAGEDRIRQPPLVLQDLPARLFSDDAVKIAHHHRVR